jgi:hypothetical protein
MVMDGAEDVEEPESRGMFRTVLAEASSIVHSMFGKLILDFPRYITTFLQLHSNRPTNGRLSSHDSMAIPRRKARSLLVVAKILIQIVSV